MKKPSRKKFLSIYFIIIAILLVFILFIAPEDLFLKNKKSETPTDENVSLPSIFSDIETQKQNLLNSNYDYEYNILDSMGKKAIQYSCTGKINGTEEQGNCTKPKKISYTEKNKNEVFKDLNPNYLNVQYVFELIKEITPKELTYMNQRILTYELVLDNLNSEIIIKTDIDKIFRIEINNAYEIYIINFDNINLK